MKRAVALISAVLIFGNVVGCNSSNQRRTASREPSVQEKFELVDEPDITADTRFAAGQLAESRSDWNRAIYQYEAALKLNPKHRPSLSRLAAAYAITRQPVKSVPAAKRFVEVTGGSPESYNDLAQCYEYANRPGDAETAYKLGIDKDPQNRLCRTNYGLLLARIGRTDEARSQMSEVLPVAEVHYNIASVLEIQGKKDEARAEYRLAIAADPNLSDAKKRLAKIE